MFLCKRGNKKERRLVRVSKEGGKSGQKAQGQGHCLKEAQSAAQPWEMPLQTQDCLPVCTGLPSAGEEHHLARCLCMRDVFPRQEAVKPLGAVCACVRLFVAASSLSWASTFLHLKISQILFFNLNDAISHHTPLKYCTYCPALPKTILCNSPNELQLRNSSAEAGMENVRTSGLLP